MDHEALTTGTKRGSLHGRAIDALHYVMAQRRCCVPTMTDIAEVLGESEDTISAMFPSICSLTEAAAEEGLIRLIDIGSRAAVTADVDDAYAQFMSLGSAYLDWAATYPQDFQLIVVSGLVSLSDNPRLDRYLEAQRTLMRRMLDRAIAAGVVSSAVDTEMLLLGCKALAQGLALGMLNDAAHQPGELPRRLATARRALEQMTHQFVSTPDDAAARAAPG